MNETFIKDVLEKYRQGATDIESAVAALKKYSFEDIGFAAVDHSREDRQGFPEVVYAAGKTKEQTRSIMERLAADSGKTVMATRASEDVFDFVRRTLPKAKYNKAARIIYIEGDSEENGGEGFRIAVVTAGTSDIPVAEEAALTATLLGNTVDTCYDCGVAGIHRLFGKLDILRRASVVIVIAGMEGALASVVGGLVVAPVIAVPTSVGYGASFGGVSALLSMLNSCAAGVSVVNIDNGFGAAVMAHKIICTAKKARESQK